MVLKGEQKWSSVLQGFIVQLLEKSDTAEHSRGQTATGVPL